jgi:hypothetical protein
MRTRTCTTTLAAVYSLLAASACRPGEDARATAETATGATQTPAAEERTSYIATEEEWQARFDTVRMTFTRDTAAAAAALRSAAATARREAAEASEATKAALTRSADELDSLAAGVSRRARRSQRSLDSAFARLEQAEGLNRLAHATDAWAKEQHARAGENLSAAADYLERSAKIADVKLDAAATKAATDARVVNDRLRQSAQVTTDEFRKTADELNAELRKLGDRIARKS